MRILLLNYEKGWRGGERQTLMSLEQFAAAGHDVALLARSGSVLAQRARALGLQVFEADSALAVCQRLWRLRRRFDVFHAQTANMMTWLALLRPVLRGRIVFTRRTAFPVSRKQWLTAWKWRQAHRFVAISEAAGAEPRRLGVTVHAIIGSAVEEIGVQPQCVADLRARFVPDARRVVATVAALSPEKDPLTMIDAVHALRQTHEDFVFLHFGADGASADAARRRVAELGLETTYVFAGFQEQIAQCYRLMDVFVLSSRQEALGSSVLDAFLYEVPVVGTSAGGLGPLLADGRGIVCPVGDSRCLARAMARALDDRAAVMQMTAMASRYVHREHGVQQMAERYLSLYALGR